MNRRICYVTGTRADFGLMQSSLRGIREHTELDLELIVTGMHLSTSHGFTVQEIRDAGLPIRAEIPVQLEPATGGTMARNIGYLVTAFTEEWGTNQPDLVLLLGDRGEMLAGAIAAIHLNLPVVHVHGGERSGTVDEPVRHAISKLSHCHFVATPASRERLIRMGEKSDNVWVVGAPGLDGLSQLATLSRSELCKEQGLDAHLPVALMVFHPVLQEVTRAIESTNLILDCLRDQGIQVVALMPNSDAGSGSIREILQQRSGIDGVRVQTHIARPRFVSWMAHCDLMIGNSSAGIIEAATFGTPVLNIGSRQNLRERNANIVDAAFDRPAILESIDFLLKNGRFPCKNIYGDGNTASRMADLLASLSLKPELMMKTNAY